MLSKTVACPFEYYKRPGTVIIDYSFLFNESIFQILNLLYAILSDNQGWQAF